MTKKMEDVLKRITGAKPVPTDKRLSTRIPYILWLQIRRLQEEGKIKSINEAVIKGLERIAAAYKK